jgi:hypothetical protein
MKSKKKAQNTVFVLVVEHDTQYKNNPKSIISKIHSITLFIHGIDVWAHSTKEKAEASLEEYVRSWWDQEMDDEPIPTDRWEAITEYFEEMENESWIITDLVIDAEMISF